MAKTWTREKQRACELAYRLKHPDRVKARHAKYRAAKKAAAAKGANQ